MSNDLVTPIIEMRGLGKKFITKTGEVTALEGINLTIHTGEVFGIIGVSGAGKSTLVRCINYLEKPTSGKVIFDGKDLGQMNSRELREARQSMGMIFQHFNLLMQRTVEENIAFPLEITHRDKKERHKMTQELLELVGLSDKASQYPAQLSGGQKQRIAIARALATNPKVLLCDEATSALDPNTTRSILNLLKDINKKLGITIVIITHEMSVVEEICTQVAIIDESKIAEVGKVEEIFAKPKSLAAQRLIYPEGSKLKGFIGPKCCRIVFDGSSSYEPVIASMILECKAAVNILFADMKNIDGTAVGEMVIQLPLDEEAANHVVRYLKSKGLVVEEVNQYE